MGPRRLHIAVFVPHPVWDGPDCREKTQCWREFTSLGEWTTNMEHLKSESDGLSKGLELCHSFLGLLDLLRIAHRTTRTKHPAPVPKALFPNYVVTRSLANTTPTMLVWPSWLGWGWRCFRFGVGLASWWRVKAPMRLLVSRFSRRLSSLRPFEWWIAWGGGGRSQLPVEVRGVGKWAALGKLEIFVGVGKGEWHVVRVAWGVVGCERTWRVSVVVVVVVVVVAGGATSPTTVKNTASPTAVTAAIPIAVCNSRSSQSLKPNGTRWKMKLKRQDETNETTRRRKTCTHKTKKRRKRRRRRRRKRKARNEKTNKRTKKGKKGKTRRLKNVTWFCYSPNTFVWPGPKQSYMC